MSEQDAANAKRFFGWQQLGEKEIDLQRILQYGMTEPGDEFFARACIVTVLRELDDPQGPGWDKFRQRMYTEAWQEMVPRIADVERLIDVMAEVTMDAEKDGLGPAEMHRFHVALLQMVRSDLLTLKADMEQKAARDEKA